MNKKTKICFFSPSSFAFFNKNRSNIKHGGAELQMFLLANELSKNNEFEIIFLVGDYKQQKTTLYNNIKLIKTFNTPQSEPFFKKIIKAFKLLFILRKNKPDIVITTAASSIPGIVSFYKKIYKIKHIHRTAHVQDVNKDWISKNGLSGKLYNYGLSNASIILTQNNDHKKRLNETHSLKSTVLKNGFDVKTPKILNKKHLLWVGRFEDWKNPNLFIDLALRLPNYNFVMICPYNSNNKKKWHELEFKAKQISNIMLIEHVPFSEIQLYFDEAVAFVNTSSSEGFPNTFLQAAQGKTPIISLNVNPDNFIDTYNCGVFCNNNFNTLIEKTEELLENKETLQTMGDNLYKYLKTNHDIKKIGKELKSLIAKMIK